MVQFDQSELPKKTFASDEFSDVSLNQWLRRLPSEMLKAQLNIDKATAMKIPAEKLALFREGMRSQLRFQRAFSTSLIGRVGRHREAVRG